jgi:hypothetical protein
MNNITIKLQVPMDKSLRDAIEKHARKLGFNSVQDFTRVMFATVVNDNLTFSLQSSSERIERLSPAAEARYARALKALPRQLKSGEAKAFANVDDFLADLKQS